MQTIASNVYSNNDNSVAQYLNIGKQLNYYIFLVVFFNILSVAVTRFADYIDNVSVTCRCGSVAEWLGRWTCDQQVMGSNPGLPTVECNPGQVVNIHVPVSPSSII